MKIIPFFDISLSQEDLDSVMKTLSGRWLSRGPRTERFEQLVARRCGTSDSIGVTSCTAALKLVLRFLGIGPGDEIIVPAYTFTATAGAVIEVGAKPVLVDTVKGGVHIDSEDIVRKITKHTKAVIPVDIGGISADCDSVIAACSECEGLSTPSSEIQEIIGRVVVIGDCAHSLGAEYRGRPTGSVYDFSCFSFHSVKNITTADGGAVTWRGGLCLPNVEIKRRLLRMSCHGIDRRQGQYWEYDVSEIGSKCNMSDYLASLGVSQLERYNEILDRRRKIIIRYRDNLADTGIEMPDHLRSGYKSSAHLMITLLPECLAGYRDRIAADMYESGVQCNVHFKPLPLMTAYKRMGFSADDCPNAIEIFSRELTLPLYPALTDDMIDMISDRYTKILKRYEKMV